MNLIAPWKGHIPMRYTIDEAIQRAEINKQTYGGEWRVVKTEDKLYIQMLGETVFPADGEQVYSTEETPV